MNFKIASLKMIKNLIGKENTLRSFSSNSPIAYEFSIQRKTDILSIRTHPFLWYIFYSTNSELCPILLLDWKKIYCGLLYRPLFLPFYEVILNFFIHKKAVCFLTGRTAYVLTIYVDLLNKFL